MLLQWATSCACYLTHTARNTKVPITRSSNVLFSLSSRNLGSFRTDGGLKTAFSSLCMCRHGLARTLLSLFFAPLPLRLRRNCRNLNCPRETNSTHALRFHFKIWSEPRDSVQSFGALPCYRKWLTEWRYPNEGPTRQGGTDIEYKNSTKTKT